MKLIVLNISVLILIVYSFTVNTSLNLEAFARTLMNISPFVGKKDQDFGKELTQNPPSLNSKMVVWILCEIDWISSYFFKVHETFIRSLSNISLNLQTFVRPLMNINPVWEEKNDWDFCKKLTEHPPSFHSKKWSYKFCEKSAPIFCLKSSWHFCKKFIDYQLSFDEHQSSGDVSKLNTWDLYYKTFYGRNCCPFKIA